MSKKILIIEDDSDTHRVFVNDKEVFLPNKEFQLLEFLMTNAKGVGYKFKP